MEGTIKVSQQIIAASWKNFVNVDWILVKRAFFILIVFGQTEEFEKEGRFSALPGFFWTAVEDQGKFVDAHDSF